MRNLLIFCVLACNLIYVNAQTAHSASGGNISGEGGSVSYTVGQMVYTIVSGASGTVNQGVQQPYEISVTTGLKKANDINLVCSVYPNPVSDYLTIKVDNYNEEILFSRLYDINGNLLETIEILANETRIKIGNQIPGTYFLKVTSGKKEVKTFKIIKY